MVIHHHHASRIDPQLETEWVIWGEQMWVTSPECRSSQKIFLDFGPGIG